MSWLRYVLLLLIAVAGLLCIPEARATSCTASATSLDFNSANPADGSTTATINYSCTSYFSTPGDRVAVSMCFAIGAGSAPSTIADRKMTNEFGDPLSFQIYKDPAGSQVWGDSPGQPSYLTLEVEYPIFNIFGFGFGGTSGQIEIHGELADLSQAASGTYRNTFSDARLIYNFRESRNPNTPKCGQGGGSTTNAFPFEALVTVAPSCKVLAASDMDFSPNGALYAARTGNITSSSVIELECTKRTAWQVGLDNGLHFDGTYRQMCIGGSPCIRYRLTTQNGQPWGNTVDVNTVPGSSMGTPQTLTVNGSVTDQPLTLAGRYSDTVKVTLTY